MTNQFVDVYGYFTYRDKTSFNYHIPFEIKSGKFKNLKGQQVNLILKGKTHYGNIIEYFPTKNKSNKFIESINFSDFLKRFKEFDKHKTQTKLKTQEGYIFFKYLHKHNPLFITKPKFWIKNLGCKRTHVGDYHIIDFKSEKGVLKIFSNIKCILIVTYNNSFNHGFMIIPIKELD